MPVTFAICKLPYAILAVFLAVSKLYRIPYEGHTALFPYVSDIGRDLRATGLDKETVKSMSPLRRVSQFLRPFMV